MSRVLEAAHNHMLGIVLVVVLIASEESVRQEAPCRHLYGKQFAPLLVSGSGATDETVSIR